MKTGHAGEVLPRDENGRRAAAGGEAAGEAGFRGLGTSKDSRPDLPQVIVGMAVTRDGIPGPLLVLAPGTPATPR